MYILISYHTTATCKNQAKPQSIPNIHALFQPQASHFFKKLNLLQHFCNIEVETSVSSMLNKHEAHTQANMYNFIYSYFRHNSVVFNIGIQFMDKLVVDNFSIA